MRKLFDHTKYTNWYITPEGDVFVSSTRYKKGILYKKKGTIHKRGYVYVRTANRNYQLHRLVAEAFIINPLNKYYVNHIDGNKTNNRWDNLEWVTGKENAQHAIRTGLTRQMKKNEGNLKYSNIQCRDVLDRINSGMKYVEAGSKYNMPYSTVAHLVRGSRRKV